MEEKSKRGDVDDYSVMENDLYIEKVLLFQQRECCSATHINVPKCKKFLTRIVAAMNKGDIFNDEESTEIFFALTKLFMSKDLTMRRLLYVVLNDMIPLTSNSFIIVNSVSKDLSDKIDSFRCSSLRCLSRLMTPQIAPAIERFFKQTLVDSNLSVQIASLICCLKLPIDIVQKYLPEINSCVDSPNALVQYHATRLFFYVKQNDQHSLLRFITTKATTITSCFAQMELIRTALKLYQQNTTKDESMINFIVNITSGATDMIIVESLRALLKVNHTKGLIKLTPKLQKLLQSSSTCTKFAGIRIVNELAVKAPEVIVTLRSDIESLIKEKNRAIVTLATSAALRIATEKNIEKLLKKIGKFIQGLPDTFRIQVLDTIEQTATKYPNKHSFLLNFLGGLLGIKGIKFVNAVISVMYNICCVSTEFKEQMLLILGDFIEDCQYEQIIQRVINIMGEIGPECNNRVKLMRIIYNRIILEGPNVRATAVSALYKFIKNEEDVNNVKDLMQKCVNDENDEVRSRALFYLNIINSQITTTLEKCIIDDFPFDNIEIALNQYIETGNFETEFSFDSISKVTQEQIQNQEEEQKNQQIENENQKKMEEIFGNLGKPIKSCPEILISGIDTEYQVSVTKILYERHIALKCMIKNTLNEYQLENVTINITGQLKHYKMVKNIKINNLPPQCEDMAVIILEKDKNEPENIPLQMTYTMREINTITGELTESVQEDEYPLDSIQIKMADFIQEYHVENWNEEWNNIPVQNEKKTVIKFPNVSTIKEAVEKIKLHFDLGVVDGSDVVSEGARKHILYLAGMMKGEVVMIRVRLMIDKTNQVPIEVCIRSPSLELSQSLYETL
ncbi:Coatomer gamma subunit, putative [Entamoeba histolytica]